MKAKEIDMKDFYTGLVNSFVVPENNGEKHTFMFNVNNDFNGRTFIEMIRKALNRDTYKMVVRGSQSDRLSYRKEGINLTDQSVPLKYADRLRVYISTINGSAILLDMANVIKELKYEREALYRKEEDLKSANRFINKQIDDLEADAERNDIEARRTEIELRNALDEVQRLEAKYGNYQLIEKWTDNPLVSMAKALYESSGAKLGTLKHFKEASGLGLKEAKNVCDALVWK